MIFNQIQLTLTGSNCKERGSQIANFKTFLVLYIRNT